MYICIYIYIIRYNTAVIADRISISFIGEYLKLLAEDQILIYEGFRRLHCQKFSNFNQLDNISNLALPFKTKKKTAYPHFYISKA